ncbi:Predicted arabinose efflux permease, MFS family [Arthrobacter sp. yr096]|uniref:MFS transporter n=1 Tax=unclassified Arthrobacter TaxID=235627 RepID=UPI000897672D|nr:MULTISPECIES: MFS transporter [unclassified Arthrobacter]SDX42763.1 Predicted arabinose efflux permease, MFS family [Arthrobacter sp. cf158]SEJ26099.1 Predicted arabinose efflux permease, MFS family [Arthrobacter sp. yr096]
MNFALYKEMLSIRPVRRLLVVGMIARIPHSAAGVLLTLHIVLTLGQGYAAAGAAAAVMTIGIALGAPWRGRRVDLVGLRKALIPSVVSETVIWSIVPHVSYEWLLPLVFVGGLFTLPIFSVVRQSLGVMVDGEQRRSAFALDSIATELVFMIGPAVGAIVATSGFSAIGLTAVGISVSAAGLFLMWFNPPTRSEAVCTPQESADRAAADLAAAEAAMVASAPAHVQEAASEMASATTRGAGIRSRVASNFTWFTVSVAALFAVAAGSGMVLSGSDVSIVGLLERGGHQNEIGIVFFFWCAASVVGGLIYGSMKRSISPMLLLLGMAALTIPMGFAQDTWTLAFLSLLPGLLCAPVLSASSEKVADLVDEERRGEAMGWYGSALTAGVALGAPLAGVFIDNVGPSAGFAAIGFAGVVLCVAGLALTSMRRRSARV